MIDKNLSANAASHWLLGAGDLAKELHAAFFNQAIRLNGAFDDALPSWLNDKGVAYAGKMVDVSHQQGAFYFGLASPVFKRKFHQFLLNNPSALWPNLIHPTASFYDANSIHLSNGVIVSAGCRLTCDIHLDFGVFLNLACTVGHDVHIGAYSSIMPGVNISGRVQMGEGVFVGSGATILQGIQVGTGAVIGAGAVVTRDVKAGQTVVGVPAKPL